MQTKQSLPIMYTHFQVNDLVGSDVCITILSWLKNRKAAPSSSEFARTKSDEKITHNAK